MKPMRAAGNVVTVLLAIVILSEIVRVATQWLVIDFLNGITPGAPVDITKANAVDANHQAANTVFLVVYVVAGLGFVVWFYQAVANLRAAGLKQMEFTPGWAIGGFFVPFLNLVRPLQV